jgi:hypothetical protein
MRTRVRAGYAEPRRQRIVDREYARVAPIYCRSDARCTAAHADFRIAESVQFQELQEVQELTKFFERRVSVYQVGITGEVDFTKEFYACQPELSGRIDRLVTTQSGNKQSVDPTRLYLSSRKGTHWAFPQESLR